MRRVDLIQWFEIKCKHLSLEDRGKEVQPEEVRPSPAV